VLFDQLLELLGVLLHLPLDAVDLLVRLPEFISDLVEDLADHTQAVDLFDVFHFSVQVLAGHHLYFH